ncbi:MAG: cyanophycinase [Pseudomonadota bacterium]
MDEHIDSADKSGRHGSLVIVGGGEDRQHSKDVLARFVELAGGPDKKIVVITAASKIPDEMWAIYDQAFGDLGVARRVPLHARSRADANNADLVRELEDADGIFMTGGDQRRLLGMIGGTALDTAIHRALKQRGACVSGTSAGASAMSGHMLADGKVELNPQKGAVSLGAGLGLVQRVVIDQHFSERHRLARLLAVVAQNPYLQGIGIDENTALVVQRGIGVEVIGDGSVTIVDGRNMISNVVDIRDRGIPELIDVRLHLLPAGCRHFLPLAAGATEPAGYREVPAPLFDFLSNIVKRTPLL